MLTRPANFTAFQMATAAERHIVVVISDGVTTWLLSDKDMQLSDGHVYPLFDPAGFSGIGSSFDIYTKAWDNSDISLSFFNYPYRVNSSAAWVRLSDEWNDLITSTCDIYFFAGPNAAALTDGLKIFSGYIMKQPAYGIEKIEVVASPYWMTIEKELPQRTISEVYGSYLTVEDYPAIAENMTRPIPLVYGSFTERTGAGDMFEGDGLAFCPAFMGGSKYEYVIADHKCYTADESILLFMDIGLMVPVQANSTADSETLKDGRYVRTVRIMTHDFLKYFYLNDNPPSDYDDSSYLPTNPANICDGDYLTKADIMDNLGDSAVTDTQTGLGVFGITNVEAFVDIFTTADPPIGRYGTSPSPAAFMYVKDLVWTSTDAFSIANDECEFRLYYSRDGNADHYCTVGWQAAAIDFDSVNTWVMIGGVASVPDPVRPTPYSPMYADLIHDMLIDPMVGLYAMNETSDDSDGTPDNDEIVAVGECRIKVTCGARHEISAWAQVSGRMFGSWIDNGGRSNPFSENEAIGHGNYIIESLLRDEGGAVTANIDEASFDAVYDSSVMTRINIYEKQMLSDIIRQLTEQSTFAFCWSSLKKARLISLNDDTPTTSARGSHPVKIPYSHIEGGNIAVSLTPEIVNKLYLESKWQAEYGRYHNHTIVPNATSQAAYGVREYYASWPNICGIGATYVANHLVGNAAGIWANPHLQIEFNMLGFTGADIELGDWIELDSITVDPQIKAFGESWSAKQFLVVGINHQLDYTTVRGIELYG